MGIANNVCIYSINSSPNFKSIQFFSTKIGNQAFTSLSGKLDYTIDEPMKIELRLNNNKKHRSFWLEDKNTEIIISNNLKYH